MNTNPNQGIRELILNKRGDRSLESLSKACGGIPTRANLDRLINRPVLSWPKENAVILGLAKGLGVRVIDVVTAYAASLGLPVATDTSNLTLEGAGNLPDTSQRILQETAENMLWWQEQRELARDKHSELTEENDVLKHENDDLRQELYYARENDIPEEDRIKSGQSYATQVTLSLAADKGESEIDPEQLPDS